MRGIAVLVAVAAALGTAAAADAVPIPPHSHYQAVRHVQHRLADHGWTCKSAAHEGPRAIMDDYDRIRVIGHDKVAPMMRQGARLLYWCHRSAALAEQWSPGDLDPQLGSELDPLHVYNSPSQNAGGGSRAWADYGLYQVVRATRPSPAAKALCGVDSVGDTIWLEGMVAAGEWELVTGSQQASDLGVVVDDPDGTHGGDCSPLGVLRRVG